MANDLVDEAAVYLTTGNPLPSDIESVINWLLNEPFVTAFQSESVLTLASDLQQAHASTSQSSRR